MTEEGRHRWRVVAYALSMGFVGLLNVGLAVAGVGDYLAHGHVLSRSGEPMAGEWLWFYVLQVLVGAVIIGHAYRHAGRDCVHLGSRAAAGGSSARTVSWVGFAAASIASLVLFGSGLISPLTPSRGCPGAGDLLVFAALPVLLCAGVGVTVRGYRRLFLLTQAVVITVAALGLLARIGCWP